MFHGLGYKAVRVFAYEYATRLGRNVPDSWNRGKISGRDLMYLPYPTLQFSEEWVRGRKLMACLTP